MDAFKHLAAVAHAYLGDSKTQAILRDFALSIQAVRLYECGFTESLNRYNAAELLLLSCLVHGAQRTALVVEAMSKADERLTTLLADAGLLEPAHV